MNPTDSGAFKFLVKGGEMGDIIRALPWEKSGLGPVEHWPSNLISTLNICLSARFPMAIYWGDEGFLLYNDAWRPILGDKHPWALGRSAKEVWPEIWDAINPLFESVRATGQATWRGDELLPMKRFGYTEECYFDYSFNPITGLSGNVEGILNIVQETTYRVLSERRTRLLSELAARSSVAKTEQEACELAISAIATDPADIPFALLYQLRTDGKQAKLIAATGLPDGHPARPGEIDLGTDHPWPVGQALQGSNTAVIDQFEGRFDAIVQSHWAESTTTALVSRVGRDTSAVLVAGVSPRRKLDGEYQRFFELVASHVASTLAGARAYAEERAKAQALAELDQAKTTFFNNVSHELRTPLTLILGPLEDEMRQNPGSHERLDLVHRNSLRLLKLVNTLLDFSRIEAGRAQAHYVDTDLAVLTADLASVFRSAMENAGLDLVVDIAPLPRPVAVDVDMWEKIVFNLLSNALKFTLKGSVRITLRPEHDGVTLKVRDTGLGIPAEELPKLFQRFHRIENLRGRSHEGTGIGLALVAELVKLHHGTIRAESKTGEGSTFRVHIPYGEKSLTKRSRDTDFIQRAGAMRGASYTEETSTWIKPALNSAEKKLPPRSGKPCVLLADDNADMRSYIQSLLGAKYDIQTVTNGAEALAAAQTHPPDLILSDVMMPEMNGLELVHRLREDKTLRSIPIVLLSARAGEEARVEGMLQGADDYLTKPFSARELSARIATHLELARLRKETQVEEERIRAINAERSSANAKFRAVFDQSSVFAGIMSPDGTLLEANRLSLGTCGYKPENEIGRPFWECGWWRGFKDTQEKLRAGVRRAAAGEIYAELLPYVWADGTKRTVEFALYPIRDENGKIIYLHPTGVDITEQLLATTRAEFLSQLTQKLSFVSDATEINRIATREIGQFLGVHRCYFFHSISADEVRVLPDWSRDDSPSLEGVYHLGQFGQPELWQAAKLNPVSIDDLGEHPWTRDFLPGYQSLKLRAFSLAPFIHEGNWVASISATSDQPRAWTEDENSLLENAVARVWPLLERARVESALRRSEERFRAMSDNIAALAWMANADGKIFWYNKRWHDYTGRSFDEMQAMGREAVHHPDHLARVLSNWETAVANGRAWEDTYPLRGADGKYRWFLSRAFPIRDEAGKIALWFGASTDVTDLRNVEDALLDANALLADKAAHLETLVQQRTVKLRETVEELEAFSYSIAHDMRAPLRSLQGFSDILLTEYAERLDPECQGFLQRIAKSAGRMDKLIQDVLNYSRVVRAELPMEPVDIEQLLGGIIDTYPALAPDKAEIVLEGKFPIILGNEALLTQIFSNLMGNGVKFMAPGVKPTLHVWAETQDHHVKISVRDNGIGIPVDQHEKIFGIFQQVNKSYEGTGIGLAIVKKAVARMGGKVGLHSVPGEGSTFWVEVLKA